MADIKVNRDSKLIKVLAAQARNERLDSAVVDEARGIIKDLVTEFTPANRYQIAQTFAYGVDELQKSELDFLNFVADRKDIGVGDKALFNVKTGGIKAFIQAKGSTTARSMVTSRQVSLETEEISARPAINIYDIRANRVDMADLIRQANTEMTLMKLMKIEDVLHSAVATYASPFYASGTGIVKASLDAQLAYFRRLGPVTILGDIAAVGQMAGLAGMAMNPGTGTDKFTQRPDSILVEQNENGFIGKYNGANVVSMANTYRDGSTTPVLSADWLYLIPGGMTGDARNLKIVNEGSVNAVDSQNIDDLVYEIRLDQWFGAGFVTGGKQPTIGAYKIN